MASKIIYYVYFLVSQMMNFASNFSLKSNNLGSRPQFVQH
jgi:hypothetical protein